MQLLLAGATVSQCSYCSLVSEYLRRLIHFAEELRLSAEAAGGKEETGKGKCELPNVTRGRYTPMSFYMKKKKNPKKLVVSMVV